MDFAIDARFAKAAGDELRYLAPEIDDESAVMEGGVGVECHGEALDESGAFVTPPKPPPEPGFGPVLDPTAGPRSRLNRWGLGGAPFG